MEASQRPEDQPAEGEGQDQEVGTGDQGEPAPIEQEPQPGGETEAGGFRQSAPPADRQSGVPLKDDREAGVEPGEAVTPEFAGDQPPKPPSSEAGTGAPAQDEQAE